MKTDTTQNQAIAKLIHQYMEDNGAPEGGVPLWTLEQVTERMDNIFGIQFTDVLKGWMSMKDDKVSFEKAYELIAGCNTFPRLCLQALSDTSSDAVLLLLYFLFEHRRMMDEAFLQQSVAQQNQIIEQDKRIAILEARIKPTIKRGGCYGPMARFQR